MLLLLAAQRGSLRHLLQWVQTALQASGIVSQQSEKTEETGKLWYFLQAQDDTIIENIIESFLEFVLKKLG